MIDEKKAREATVVSAEISYETVCDYYDKAVSNLKKQTQLYDSALNMKIIAGNNLNEARLSLARYEEEETKK